jgi:hypothetical protein
MKIHVELFESIEWGDGGENPNASRSDLPLYVLGSGDGLITIVYAQRWKKVRHRLSRHYIDIDMASTQRYFYQKMQ